MTVQQYIAHDIEPLAPTDTVGHAIYRFADLDVKHLPVVDGKDRLVALVAEDELLDLTTPGIALADVAGLGALSASPDVHLFEAANLLAAHGLSVLPVVDADGSYLGLVSRRSLFEQFAKMLSIGRTGAILVLDVSPRDYSLSQVSHLVEQNNGKVLSATTQAPYESDFDPSLVRITLKVNVTDTARIRHVLEHHGYHVAAAFNEDENDEGLSLRVQEFMRYLEA